jgi:hypothetical protein
MTGAERLIEQGRQEGFQEGVREEALQTYRRLLTRLLRHTLGKVPAAVVRRIEATDRLDLLEAWFDQACAMTRRRVGLRAEVARSSTRRPRLSTRDSSTRQEKARRRTSQPCGRRD